MLPIVVVGHIAMFEEKINFSTIIITFLVEILELLF